MSAFVFETRTCPRCDQEWEALDFWDADIACDACGTKEYRAWIEAANAGRRFHVVSIGGAMPTQAEGVTADGSFFYFRARHGHWSLSVADTQQRAYTSQWLADGDDPTGGDMARDAVLAILDTHLGGA